MSNIKVGDKLTVRTDLKVGRMYGKDNVVPEMLPYGGKEVVVTKVCENGKLRIENGIWNWTPEMFENKKPSAPATDLKIGDKVYLKDELKGTTTYGIEFGFPEIRALFGRELTVGTADNSDRTCTIKESPFSLWFKMDMFTTETPEVVEPPKREKVMFTLDEIYFDFADDVADYILIGDTITIAIPKDTPVGIATKHPSDEPCAEIGKALAFKRMVEDSLEEM